MRAAHALRLIADAKMYGLISGGPHINVARCDRIIERGRLRGIRLSRSAVDLARAYVKAWNEEAGRAASS